MELCPLPGLLTVRGMGHAVPVPNGGEDYGKRASFYHQKRKVLHSFLVVCRLTWLICEYLNVCMCTNTQVTSRKHNVLYSVG